MRTFVAIMARSVCSVNLFSDGLTMVDTRCHRKACLIDDIELDHVEGVCAALLWPRFAWMVIR
jgi:hypothetical protein